VPATAAAGSAPAPSAPKPAADPTDWIEIELVGEDGKPIPGVRYTITPRGGAPRSGVLDASGRARLVGLKPGDCDITFPDLDADAWQKN
jgi:hypothetical protein